MRACFLGRNICGLGFGVATLHAPPLIMDAPAPASQPDIPEGSTPAGDEHVSQAPVLRPYADTQTVAISPRLSS